MNNNKFGQRLKDLRAESGLTLEHLAENLITKYPKTKFSKAVLSRYENGKAKPKNFTTIVQLANYYGVHPDFLMGISDDKYKENSFNKCSKKIPVLGTIAAGTPILAQQYIEGYEYTHENECIDFCLRVKGDSMIGARIYDGDIVFIRKQPDVENGEIAAVIIDGEEATLKRVYKIDGKVILHAENPKYHDRIIGKTDRKNIRIIGKVKSVKFDIC
ncbi:MAG TPA: helix-turn-helix domain-containing protein [Gallicola sp.]|nr:helix-turn-helix domain-containing protein [Gallicola sp.]